MTLAPDDSLIGRTRELERLRRYVDSVAYGATATLLIEGEAGIGKTRLLMNLIETARASGLTVFHGEAHPLERTRPFGALVGALDLRSGSSDPHRAAIGRLLAAEATVGPDAAPPGALQFRVVDEIIDLIEALSDQGPVLLALDDLHWADSSTLLAFRWLTSQLTSVPLLLVATLRPSPRTAELDQLLEDCRLAGAERLALEPLEQPEVDALLQAELGLPAGPALTEAVGRAGETRCGWSSSCDRCPQRECSTSPGRARRPLVRSFPVRCANSSSAGSAICLIRRWRRYGAHRCSVTRFRSSTSRLSPAGEPPISSRS